MSIPGWVDDDAPGCSPIAARVPLAASEYPFPSTLGRSCRPYIPSTSALRGISHFVVSTSSSPGFSPGSQSLSFPEFGVSYVSSFDSLHSWPPLLVRCGVGSSGFDDHPFGSTTVV